MYSVYQKSHVPLKSQDVKLNLREKHLRNQFMD